MSNEIVHPILSVAGGLFCGWVVWSMRRKMRATHQTVSEFADTKWSQMEEKPQKLAYLKAILSHPGLYFDGIDPTMRDTYNAGEGITEEYKICLFGRMVQLKVLEYNKLENKREMINILYQRELD